MKTQLLFIMSGLMATGLTAMAASHEVTLRSNGTAADVAVSVIDNKLATAEKENTILTSLLLNSDLRGSVEEAVWYFPDSLTHKHRQGMDGLMLTQGWSRYDIPAAIDGRITETIAPLEKGLTVCGNVKSQWMGSPIKNALINVIVPSMRIATIAETDAKGQFCIEGVDVPEGTMMILQALNSEGINETNLTIYPDSLPTVMPLPPLEDDINEADDKGNRLLANTILLSDIEVNGTRRARYNGVASAYSVTASDISAMKAGSVEQVLRSIPGISIVGDKVDYRGGSVMMLIYDQGTVSALNPDETYSAVDKWTPPTPVQDWVIARNHASNTNAMGKYIPPVPQAGPTPKRDEPNGYVLYSSLPIEDVSRIDYYSPETGGAFGITDFYSGGVIMVRLKQPGQRVKRYDDRYKEYMPLGYQRSKTFYTPKYELMADYELNIHPTLYWIPSATVDRFGNLSLPIPAAVDSYTVIAEGIDADGHPVRLTKSM